MFSLSTKVQGYLIKGLLALACAGLVWANFQMLQAKDDRIKLLDEKVAALAADNEQLKTDLVNKGKSEVTTEQVKVEVKVEEGKVAKAKTQANLYVEKKLAEIEKKYSEMEKTAANEERKRTEISLERAKGVWLSFCLQEPEVPACK